MAKHHEAHPEYAELGIFAGYGEADPRDPDYNRTGMFVLHNCYRCKNGEKPCVQGAPNRCEYPRARND